MILSLLLLMGMQGTEWVQDRTPIVRCTGTVGQMVCKCVDCPADSPLAENPHKVPHVTEVTPEPLEVPAIEFNHWATAKDIGFERSLGGASVSIYRDACLEIHRQWSDQKVACLREEHTCLDKSNILEHDENSPPNY